MKRQLAMLLAWSCCALLLLSAPGCGCSRQGVPGEEWLRLQGALNEWQRVALMLNYLDVLEMLDRGEVADAKKRVQQLLYIQVASEPETDLLRDDPLAEWTLPARSDALERAKAFHDKHRDEIDMMLPSNQKAVAILERLGAGPREAGTGDAEAADDSDVQ
jgi:hypothetical protein